MGPGQRRTAAYESFQALVDAYETFLGVVFTETPEAIDIIDIETLPGIPQGEGIGTRFMVDAKRYADQTGRRLTASAVINPAFFASLGFMRPGPDRTFVYDAPVTSKLATASGRVYYRGTDPTYDGPRITTGHPDWDDCLFVADTPDNARLYGPQVEAVALDPSTRILHEQSPEGQRVITQAVQRARSPEGGHFAVHAINEAKARGYDAMHFKDQGAFGTAIWNRDKVVVRTPHSASTRICPTCHDPLKGEHDTFCPRCQWSEHDPNLDSDPLSNPPDPTVDMHRGIQSAFTTTIPSHRWFVAVEASP